MIANIGTTMPKNTKAATPIPTIHKIRIIKSLNVKLDWSLISKILDIYGKWRLKNERFRHSKNRVSWYHSFGNSERRSNKNGLPFTNNVTRPAAFPD